MYPYFSGAPASIHLVTISNSLEESCPKWGLLPDCFWMSGLFCASPGKITITPTDNVTVTPLFTTTDKSTEVDKAQLGFMADPQELLRNYRPSGEEAVLAARITGKVKSAFPGLVVAAKRKQCFTWNTREQREF